MKRFMLLGLAALSLSGCDYIPTVVGEEVRPVQVGQTFVDDDMGELHVDIIDVETHKKWDINLGEECRQYPLPMGEEFLARFNRWASKKKPNDVSISPQEHKIWTYLCG